MADLRTLDKETRRRYTTVYCGICRQLRERCGGRARLGLSYDMAFLALLLMSLYEPEEAAGDNACGFHPFSKRPWVDSDCIRYAADMNIALAYYNCMDDYTDEGRRSAKLVAGFFEKALPRVQADWPRQCSAIESCLSELHRLEKENCANPDEPAGTFGRLMGELLVYREDRWSATLRQMGMALGRYIYLADAAVDYRRDIRKNQYNPLLAMNQGESLPRWEEYLYLAMGRCTDHFERLPLVQDKALLDNILYSGVWLEYRKRLGKRKTSLEDSNAR